MKKYCLIILIIFFNFNAYSSNKENIVSKLENIYNINFNFEQNVNNKIENGNCTVQYPKKIFCSYNSSNKKILVSDGKWLVIKTLVSYYRYPLNKTHLNYLLDKDFLIKKIRKSNHRIIENKFINFNFNENENEINIFFDIDNYNLIGWQTLDLYQNLSITYLSSLKINQEIKKNLFKLPERNDSN